MKKTYFIGVGAGFLVVAGSFVLFGFRPISYFFSIIGLIIAVIPIVINVILSQNKQKEKEEKFIAFSRDLVENVKSGTPISKGIVNLKNRNYGALSSHVSKLANQISLGITLTEALRNFARETESKVIARAVGLISEAERAGGKIETILESVALSVNQIENLRKERKAAVSNLITQGYIIFIVFIIIMLVLEFKILPLVADLSVGTGGGLGMGQMTAGGLGIDSQKISPDDFSMPLFVLLLVQSFFAGLVIGKVSEGNLKAGIKHSFILLALTLLVTTGARALLT